MAQQLTKRAVRKLRAVVRDHERRPRNAETRRARGRRLNPLINHLAKNNTNIAKGAPGDCTVYTGDPGSETASDIIVSAFNKFGDLLEAGTWLWLCWNGFGWYAIQADIECEDE